MRESACAPIGRDYRTQFRSRAGSAAAAAKGLGSALAHDADGRCLWTERNHPCGVGELEQGDRAGPVNQQDKPARRSLCPPLDQGAGPGLAHSEPLDRRADGCMPIGHLLYTPAGVVVWFAAYRLVGRKPPPSSASSWEIGRARRSCGMSARATVRWVIGCAAFGLTSGHHVPRCGGELLKRDRSSASQKASPMSLSARCLP